MDTFSTIVKSCQPHKTLKNDLFLLTNEQSEPNNFCKNMWQSIRLLSFKSQIPNSFCAFLRWGGGDHFI